MVDHTVKTRDPDIKTCRVEWMDISQGVRQWTCYSRDCISPIGVVWTLEQYSKVTATTIIEVLDSYVLPRYRRRGVRTKIQECMLNRAERVVVRSTEGSKEGGEAFMRAAGYTYDRQRSEWYFIKPKRRKPR
jgi:hypothetical protein